MKIVVTGGRDLDKRDWVRSVLAALGVTHLGVGDCPTGLDAIAREWAQDHGVPCAVFVANWGEHGKAAGPIRNHKMLEEFAPELVIAFPGGPGTANTAAAAVRMGIPVWRIKEPTNA